MDSFWSNSWTLFEQALKKFCCYVFHDHFSEASWQSYMQFIKFGIVGFSNTVIGYLIYAITLKGLRLAQLWPSVDIYLAQLNMFFLSVAWSFYWNNSLVFKQQSGEKRNIVVAMIKTYVSYALTCLFLAEALLYVWVNVLGINEYVAPALTLILTVPLNYLIQKYWAFSQANR